MFHSVHTILVHLGPFGCVTKHSAKRAKLMQKFVPRGGVGFFSTNTTDPPHWTPNSCFGVYCTIWMQFGPFRCRTKLGAKRAELVEKYVPRSRVIIFRIKHTGFDPNGTETHVLVRFILFWCIWYRFIALQNWVQ